MKKLKKKFWTAGNICKVVRVGVTALFYVGFSLGCYYFYRELTQPGLFYGEDYSNFISEGNHGCKIGTGGTLGVSDTQKYKGRIVPYPANFKDYAESHTKIVGGPESIAQLTLQVAAPIIVAVGRVILEAFSRPLTYLWKKYF